ncbi:MAG: RDD family protein [Chloroflexi bacterium]|jgi:uncharacterized RDD family membrane protein YckC|nr:RDD family protein [Chloroflexota bacterium]
MQIEREIQVRICPYCGYNRNEISQPVCVDCGQILPITARIVTKVIKVEAESPEFSPGMQTDREIHEKVCTYCSAGNPPWSSFCAYCGQPLQKVCANCGADSPSWGSFCAHCGEPIPITPKRIVRVRVEYAGFWRRFVASIIDGIIMNILNAPLSFVFTSAYYYGLGSLFELVYTLGFWSWRSQTPGKMALGVKIVTEDGKPIAMGRAIIRYFCYFISAIPLGLGFLWIAWDSKKQGWHDKIAGTYVIRD